MKVPRRRILLLAAGAVVLVGGVLLVAMRSGGGEIRYATAAVDRGDVSEVVGATGTLQAVTTVQVGSQVSGTVSELNADFNSRVTKNQVVARLDPSSFQARVGQAQANLVSARANVERQQAEVTDARQKRDRAEALAQEQLLPQSDLETARSTYAAAQAQLKANQAAVTQAAAAVNQAQVDLDHTIIRAPIDGIVVGRSVDVGQTVAASLQAPVLFTIAQDLSQMQVLTSIDEADIGRVSAGQNATFRVDAFPDQTFEGTVDQVRLQPTTVSNVVTYNAMITVANPGQKLMPGMTATVSLIVRQRKDVLRMPATALRFRPEGAPDERAGRGQGAGGAAPQAAGGAAPQAAGGERRRGPGGGDGSGGGGGNWRQRGGPRADDAAPGGGDGAERGRPATVYVPGAKDKPQAERVRVGMSDGQFVEVVSGLAEGARVITGVDGQARSGGGARPSPAASNNPFTPGRPERRQRN
jgi:HlyD family secretion protein